MNMSLQFSNPLFHIAVPVPPTPKIKNPKLLIPHFTRNKYLHDLQVVKCSKEDHQVIGSPLVHGKYTHNLTLDAIPPPSPLPNYDVSKEDFPDDFLFGASTSALQTEGRGCEGGRGKGTWDSMIEADKGRKAVDSYNLYKDVGVGLGVVIRDHEGKVVRSACQQLRQPWEVPIAEAKAIVLGLWMAIQCDARRVVVECDNLQVINLINGRKMDGSSLGMTSREIQVVSKWFDDIRFVHVFREANVVAHAMAHITPLDFSTRVWEDVKLLKEMGMNLYRFSISWSRILPDGTIHSGINREGINFYNKLIDELLDNGITPMITLMHFDLPQAIQDEFGGFLSPNISTHFKEYADHCFQEFGDRVKYWETINEPLIYAYLGKKMGFPPQLQTEPNSVYTAYHNIILAHSVAAKLYKQRYQKKQGGKIGVSLPIQWSMPFSDDPKDLAATEASVDLTVGWFMNPLVYGDYPEWIKKNINGLPEFNQEQKELVKGAYDFIGINYYTSRFMQHNFSYDGMTGEITITFKTQIENAEKKNLGKPAEGRKDIYHHPDGLKQLLRYMQNKYDNPEMYVTENGISSQPRITGSYKDLLKHGKIKELQDELYDYDRIKYTAGHLIAIHDAMSEGANVKGYVVWSLLDNMEVGSGYDVRFGLNYVDYFDNCKRYPKLSAKWFSRFLKAS